MREKRPTVWNFKFNLRIHGSILARRSTPEGKIFVLILKSRTRQMNVRCVLICMRLRVRRVTANNFAGKRCTLHTKPLCCMAVLLKIEFPIGDKLSFLDTLSHIFQPNNNEMPFQLWIYCIVCFKHMIRQSSLCMLLPARMQISLCSSIDRVTKCGKCLQSIVARSPIYQGRNVDAPIIWKAACGGDEAANFIYNNSQSVNGHFDTYVCTARIEQRLIIVVCSIFHKTFMESEQKILDGCLCVRYVSVVYCLLLSRTLRYCMFQALVSGVHL